MQEMFCFTDVSFINLMVVLYSTILCQTFSWIAVHFCFTCLLKNCHWNTDVPIWSCGSLLWKSSSLDHVGCSRHARVAMFHIIPEAPAWAHVLMTSLTGLLCVASRACAARRPRWRPCPPNTPRWPFPPHDIWPFPPPQVPLRLIETAESRDMFQLHIICKDSKVVR